MQPSLRNRTAAAIIAAASLCVFAFAARGDSAFAQTAAQNDLRAKIAENNRKIEDLQRQIDQYASLYNATSKEAQTLRNALNQLEISQKKLEANLALTSTQISKTSLTLEDLNEDIDEAEEDISSKEAAIAESMRGISQAESQSTLEQFLGAESISDAWDYVNGLRTLQGRVKVELTELRDLRMLLGAKRDQALGEKTKLEQYRKSLADQQKVVEINKATKDQLLKETQNKQENYKAELDKRIAEKAQFEKELFEYESRLNANIDQSAVAEARSGVLSWPVQSAQITQYFGKTVSAKRLYTSGTHGGIDLRAPIGTPLKAALSGVVTDVEAVRSKRGCQYGKFVLIRHANGLSTIYGHMSVVSVSAGDVVATGDLIGYSGDTGYATGPHLHFGVYATEGVRVVDASGLGSSNCKGIKTVAAPPTAYLDPMAYLPKL